jgi:tetratricopeptide (TPR) repeat protein
MAVTYCRQAVDMEPGSLTYGGLGEAYFATDQLDSAIVYLRLAVEQDPSNGRFRFNLANSLEIAGYYEEAESHFTAYLVQVPNDPVGHFNYGIHLDKAGRHAEGMLEVSRAIDLDPNMLTARVVLIQMLENDGQYDSALSEVAALRLMDPANANELDQWAARIASARDAAGGAGIEGRIHLLYMILSTPEERDQVVKELEAGEDFAGLAVRFSRGSAASKGGDIGWIDPEDMVEPMRSLILELEPNEISPPLEAGGLFHLFKRVP